MISQMVDVVNKAPSFHWWEGLKFVIELHPILVGFPLIISLIFSIISIYLFCRRKTNGNLGVIIILLSPIICLILVSFSSLRAILPRSVFSQESQELTSYLYVVKSDTKSMNKIKNSQTTLYYDKQHRVLNEFPTKLTAKDKNEATVNDKKIKSLVLNGSKEQALRTLIDSPILKKMDKILAVSTTGNKTTIEYTEEVEE